MLQVFAELEAITDKLATDSQRGSYTKKTNNGINGSPPSPVNTVQSEILHYYLLHLNIYTIHST
jgi:hypothetical protein